MTTPTHKTQQTVVISYINAIELDREVGHYDDIFCNTFT